MEDVTPTQQAQSRGPRKWLPILIVVALIVVGLAMRARQGKQANAPAAGNAISAEKGAAEISTVKTVAVKTGPIAEKLNVTGSLKTDQNINLSTRITGRVDRVLVREGSRVRRGDLLVVLEDDDLRAQADAARSALRSAQVHYRQTVLGVPARVQQVTTAIRQAQSNIQTAQARYRQALLSEPAKVRDVYSTIQQAEAVLGTSQSKLRQAEINFPLRKTTAQSQVETARETVNTAQSRLAQSRETARQTEQQVNAEIERNRGAVGQAQAALAEVKRGSREQQIRQAQAQLAVAEAQLRNTETELTRQKTLFEGGAAPRASVDTAQTAYDVAKAQVEQARQNLSLVQEGATTEQVRQAEEGVRQAQASLASAEAGKSRTLVAQQDVTAALAALAQSQEQLRTAQANLAQIPLASQDIQQAREGVDQSRAALSHAKARELEIPITREDTRRAREDVRLAQIALTQAEANRSAAPIAREDIASSAAAVDSARAQLDQAIINLNNSRLRSPVNGVINQKLTDAGQAVTPGTALLNIVSLDRIYMEALVSETNIARVQVGQPASITVPSVSTAALDGFVSDIIPVADPKARQFRVRISVPNAPSELKPNSFARGVVTTQTFTGTLLVPTQAISNDEGNNWVFVVKGGRDKATVERRTVKTGIATDDQTQILGGLEANERVAVGNATLENGDTVKWVDAQAPAA